MLVKKIFYYIILFFLISFSLYFPAIKIIAVDPYITEELNFEIGNNQIAEGTQLGNQNPVIIASYIINVMLGVLGLIFLGLTIYGGFKWMKARGNEEEVTKAKQTITAAVIGLVIILSSYGISTYIFRVVYNITL